jgi:UDP-3-O-[3-hydroxymyristoyl] N-acetylglucosamine deacetylase/3-hydroxyacyl-[acyl-carrier-protein] dehydratase
MKQTTIKKSVEVNGVGLHTGQQVTMIFNPAADNHGIKFQRVDLPGKPIIDADVDNVTDLSRGTTLEQHGGKVATVEHTMAALAALEIDNCLIHINADETPIMDGSSIFFFLGESSTGGRADN